MKKTLVVLASFILAFSLSSCKEDNGGTNPTPTCTPIADSLTFQFNSPKGGETYKVGEKLTIDFKVNEDKIDQYVPELTIDNGKSWTILSVGGGIKVTSGCMKFEYTIPTDILDATSNQCKIKLRLYTDESIKVISEPFTIQK